MATAPNTKPVDLLPATETFDEGLIACRQYIRQIELFSYGRVSAAVGPKQVFEARTILRLAIGLRRLLDRLA